MSTTTSEQLETRLKAAQDARDARTAELAEDKKAFADAMEVDRELWRERKKDVEAVRAAFEHKVDEVSKKFD